MKNVSIFWFRRDLRIDDNVGLSKALSSGYPVLPIFVYDPDILLDLPQNDARVTFIHDQITDLGHQLKEKNGRLAVFHDTPESVFKDLVDKYNVQAVFCNRDYEPFALERDTRVEKFLKSKNIKFETHKDQVIFERDEVIKADGSPYVVYTPYRNAWLGLFSTERDHFQKDQLKVNFLDDDFKDLALEDLSFRRSEITVPDFDISTSSINGYEEKRDYPNMDATTHLGPFLRFGVVSIRSVVQKATESKNHTLLNELIWREFFMQVLWHFPNTVGHAFRKEYDHIEWRNNEREFDLWKQGKTGYPLVDAGMRQLNETGFMHNRVRMLVASFLCKHLLIDWRWGEAYFAEKLLDYELSSNVGNWQWAAGSGVDAAPYFRIFNPKLQIDKFDKEREYVIKWIPELKTDSYPPEIVDHKEARDRCLKVYKAAVARK